MTGLVKRTLVARTVACGVTLAAFGASGASATIFDFSFTNYGGQTASFSIDTLLAPTSFASGQRTTELVSDLVIGGGQPRDASVDFYNPNAVNGLAFGDGQDGVFFSSATPFYSGPESNPTFVAGTYDLHNFFGVQSPSGQLTISQAGAPGAPAPEVGVGILSALAAGLALALTRTRRFNPFRAFATA